MSSRHRLRRKFDTSYENSSDFLPFHSRIKRQSSSGSGSVRLQLEMRDEPRPSTTVATGIGAEILSNIAAIIINRYQAGELQVAWINLNISHGLYPTNLTNQGTIR